MMPTRMKEGLLAGLLLIAITSVSAELTNRATVTKDWLTWGPYRPGLYFGVRPNIPESLLMGAMWGNGKDQNTLARTLRDTCEQDDGVESYGWTVYDPRVGGSQTIRDRELGIDLTTEFVKNEDGSGWAVRVSGIVRPDATEEKVITSLIFHVAMEGAVGSSTKGLLCERLTGTNGHIDGVECRGKDPVLGPFDFRINADPKDQVIKASSIRSKRVSEEKTWQAKSVYKDMLFKGPNKDDPGAGNMHLMRFDFEGPFSATFSYRDEGGLHISPDAIVERLEDLGPSYFAQVHKAFPITSPFRGARQAAFSQALLSNLLGGLGFFYGDSKVSENVEDDGGAMEALVVSGQAMADTKITTTKPNSLLSFTPSRSFFPRGFLWDEGFHLLPILEWDIDLAINVLRSWLSQMSDDGWIAREQILGPEARSRVPEEFQVQHPHHANPPTFIALVLPALLAKLTSKTPYNGHKSKYLTSHTERNNLLSTIYPALSQYYMHFRRTQAGNFNASYPRPDGAVKGEAYRWRGRTLQHMLASGLDDYPRAETPSPGELHVDALAWVGASAKALTEVAEYLSLEDEAAVYREHLRDVQLNLDVLHWSDRDNAYCDATVHQDTKYAHVCHVGYVSLMPLLLGLINSTHPQLPALLTTLADPSHLWSPHGLRSLSLKDEFYGKDEDYWRGAVWMNLNTLAVLRLRDIGLEGETAPSLRALKLAEELRTNALNTVYTSWLTTGYVWEQYGDASGEGKRSRGFTGWTAAVLLLLGLDLWNGNGEGELEDGTPVSPNFANDETSEKMAGQMMSTKTVLFWVALTLLLMLLRRRLLRISGRIAGAWRAKGRGGSWRARAATDGRYDEAIPLEERTD